MELCEQKHLGCESGNTGVPDVYEVFSTAYGNGEVSRGIRAKQSISRGVLVEVAHCIQISKYEYEHHLRHSVLENYLFVGRNGGMLLALGAASLFNHSKQPNLNYTIDHEQLVIRFRAARDIAPNGELTITYGSDSKLWFKDMSVISAESSVSMLHDYLDDETLFLASLQI